MVPETGVAGALATGHGVHKLPSLNTATLTEFASQVQVLGSRYSLSDAHARTVLALLRGGSE
jgi:hypothetical protein